MNVALRLQAEYSCRMLDFATQYEAMRRRGPRPDGIVVVAVKTTGIYCRPVCKVRTPLARNVEFYPNRSIRKEADAEP